MALRYISKNIQSRQMIPFGLSVDYRSYENTSESSKLKFDEIWDVIEDKNVLVLTYDHNEDMAVYDPQGYLYNNVFVTSIGQRRYFSKDDVIKKRNVGMVESDQIVATVSQDKREIMGLNEIINTFHPDSDLGQSEVKIVRNLSYVQTFGNHIYMDCFDASKTCKELESLFYKSGYVSVDLQPPNIDGIIRNYFQGTLQRNAVHVFNAGLSVFSMYGVALLSIQKSELRAYTIRRLHGATHLNYVSNKIAFFVRLSCVGLIVSFLLIAISTNRDMMICLLLIIFCFQCICSIISGFYLKNKYRRASHA